MVLAWEFKNPQQRCRNNERRFWEDGMTGILFYKHPLQFRARPQWSSMDGLAGRSGPRLSRGGGGNRGGWWLDGGLKCFQRRWNWKGRGNDPSTFSEEVMILYHPLFQEPPDEGVGSVWKASGLTSSDIPSSPLSWRQTVVWHQCPIGIHNLVMKGDELDIKTSKFSAL